MVITAFGTCSAIFRGRGQVTGAASSCRMAQNTFLALRRHLQTNSYKGVTLGWDVRTWYVGLGYKTCSKYGRLQMLKWRLAFFLATSINNLLSFNFNNRALATLPFTSTYVSISIGRGSLVLLVALLLLVGGAMNHVVCFLTKPYQRSHRSGRHVNTWIYII